MFPESVFETIDEVTFDNSPFPAHVFRQEMKFKSLLLGSVWDARRQRQECSMGM